MTESAEVQDMLSTPVGKRGSKLILKEGFYSPVEQMSDLEERLTINERHVSDQLSDHGDTAKALRDILKGGVSDQETLKKAKELLKKYSEVIVDEEAVHTLIEAASLIENKTEENRYVESYRKLFRLYFTTIEGMKAKVAKYNEESKKGTTPLLDLKPDEEILSRCAAIGQYIFRHALEKCIDEGLAGTAVKITVQDKPDVTSVAPHLKGSLEQVFVDQTLRYTYDKDGNKTRSRRISFTEFLRWLEARSNLRAKAKGKQPIFELTILNVFEMVSTKIAQSPDIVKTVIQEDDSQISDEKIAEILAEVRADFPELAVSSKDSPVSDDVLDAMSDSPRSEE